MDQAGDISGDESASIAAGGHRTNPKRKHQSQGRMAGLNSKKVKKNNIVIAGEPIRKVKKAVPVSKGPRPASPSFNTSMTAEKPDIAASKPKKKKVPKQGGMSSLAMRPGNSSSLSDL